MCRCTDNGGATVHLLESPTTAHLHQHGKIFINKSKYSASARPSRRGVPRRGTKPARRGISGKIITTPGQRRNPHHQGSSTEQGETWPSHIQAALHQPGGTTCKGANCLHAPPSVEMPSASLLHHLYGGMTVISMYSSGHVSFLLSTPMATPPSPLS